MQFLWKHCLQEIQGFPILILMKRIALCLKRKHLMKKKSLRVNKKVLVNLLLYPKEVKDFIGYPIFKKQKVTRKNKHSRRERNQKGTLDMKHTYQSSLKENNLSLKKQPNIKNGNMQWMRSTNLSWRMKSEKLSKEK